MTYLIFIRFIPSNVIHKITTYICKKISSSNIICTFLERILYPKINSKYVSVEFLGKRLKNPIGIAAGCDKDAVMINFLYSLCFGFVEVGTVLIKEQKANDGKLYLRDYKNRSLYNRVGFKSVGVDKFIENINRTSNYKDKLIGINIGKCRDTDISNSSYEYSKLLNLVQGYADYIVINISSPNTDKLIDLHKPLYLSKLITEVKRNALKPLFIKISPQEDNPLMENFLTVINDIHIDGIVISNTLPTTTDIGRCGLSGKLLTKYSLNTLKYILRNLTYDLNIISVGGISNAMDILVRFYYGASLVQLYTAFIYDGPLSVRSIIKDLNIILMKYNITLETIKEEIKLNNLSDNPIYTFIEHYIEQL